VSYTPYRTKGSNNERRHGVLDIVRLEKVSKVRNDLKIPQGSGSQSVLRDVHDNFHDGNLVFDFFIVEHGCKGAQMQLTDILRLHDPHHPDPLPEMHAFCPDVLEYGV